MKKMISAIHRTYFLVLVRLFLATLVGVLAGNTSLVLAADNASANDLQQLQALQQQIPSSPPIRQNLQLNGNNPPATNSAAQTPIPAVNNIAAAAGLPAANPNVNFNSPSLITGQANIFPQAPQQAAPGGFSNQQTASFNQQPAIPQGSVRAPEFQAPFTTPGNPTGDTEISQAAFSNMTNSALPMTPDQIHRLKQLFTATQYAQAAPAGIPPRPVATSQIVNLAPGATPPVIRLAQGFVTSLVFIDSTGAPWPIDSYSIGDPQRFNIQWNKTDNTLMIQAMSLYNYGNLAVRLKGLVTPVMLTLIPGQKDIDYRVDLRVQGLGPNAAPVLGDSLPGSANPILLDVLDGIPPPGSKELNVCGADFQAWLCGDKIYVRTHFTILSPAWHATMSSADGTKAYEMQKTPMLLVSLHGKAVPIKIEGL